MVDAQRAFAGVNRRSDVVVVGLTVVGVQSSQGDAFPLQAYRMMTAK